MKKVKLLLEPAEVEMIRDALEVCYDEGDLNDNDMLEGLCKAFGILAMDGNFVKVSVDDHTQYVDDCDNCVDDVSEDVVSDCEDCQCDECRVDRGLPPLDGEGDDFPVNDDDQLWDATDEDCWDTDECSECGVSPCECNANEGCGVTKQDLEDAWNANEPWNTNKK